MLMDTQYLAAPGGYENDPYYPIYRAVCGLAGSDEDGASLRNDVGFNRFDTEFGKSLASRPWNRWTPAQKRSAWVMLRKYRNQIAIGLGIDYSAIPEPPDPTHYQQASPDVRFGEAQPNISKPVAKSIAIEGETIVIRFAGMPKDEFQALVNDAKEIPGREFWKYKNKDEGDYDPRWIIPLTPFACTAVNEFALKHKFNATREVKDRVRAVAAQNEIMEAKSRAEDAELVVPDFGGNGLEPMPFQRAGISYGAEVQRLILADDMGLGKTIQALGIIQMHEAYPVLVIVPAVVKINWKKEADKWLHNRTTVVINGSITAAELQVMMPDVVVINYDIIAKNVDELSQVEWKAIVFDEGHRLKNSKSQRSAAAEQLADGVPIRIWMTGTPILNRPNELVHPLKLIGRMKDVSPKGIKAFLNRYCGGWDGYGYNGATNTEELHRILRQTCMIRRLKEDVLTELPEVFRTVISLPIDNWSEYNRAAENIISWVGEQAAAEGDFLASLNDLNEKDQEKEIKARRASAEERARRAEILVRIEKLKQVAARGKLKRAIKWIHEFFDENPDKKLIVFANHQDIEKALLKEFPDISVGILGGMDNKVREAAKDRFQEDPKIRLIVCALLAASEGITLTASSTVVFLELGWTPAAHDQAEARAHRIGQRFNVSSYYLVANETIEEEIAALLDEKRKVFKAVANGQELEQGESIMEGLWAYLRDQAAKMENGELPIRDDSDYTQETEEPEEEAPAQREEDDWS